MQSRYHFYPRSPCGERHPVKSESLTTYLISIHALLAESDDVNSPVAASTSISIHALLAESDLAGPSGPAFLYNFYPRSPCGERPVAKRTTDIKPPFLSTLSLRRATGEIDTRRSIKMISIHALLAESDVMHTLILANAVLFLSTLSLRRATVMHTLILANAVLFLSTLSLRRATIIRQHSEPDSGNFYPRSPCGERPGSVRGLSSSRAISIHALLAESDGPLIFNVQPRKTISIHALLAESDRQRTKFNGSASIFLSTLSLRRATIQTDGLFFWDGIFLSTLSLRRATKMFACIGFH